MRELFKVQIPFNLILCILSLFIVESVEENRILTSTLAYFTTLGCAAFFPPMIEVQVLVLVKPPESGRSC